MKLFHSALLAGCSVCFLGGNVQTACARQNILIGAMSIRYDHQERTYDNVGRPPTEPRTGVTSETGTSTAQLVDDRRGDRQTYIITPRLTFSSAGTNDLFEISYAPGLNYDHIYDSTELDHDFALRLEKDITRVWHVSVNDNYFLGDDPVREEELRSRDSTESAQESADQEPVVGAPVDDSGENLTDIFGRRRYWTNTLDVLSVYEYGEGRSVSVGYTYDVLRNEDSNLAGGYTDYDRHTALLRFQHRFDRQWYTEGEANYSKGLFDDIERTTSTRALPESLVSSTGGETLGAGGPFGAGNEVDRNQEADYGSGDLVEYLVRIRGGYAYSPHLDMFTEYSFQQTDYDDAGRDDYSVHNVALGLDYDLTTRLHCTLSGGPSWGVLGDGSTEMDYNAYGAIIWDFLHGTTTVSAEKGYSENNFDGRRSGLTDFWSVGFSLDYQFSPSLAATVSASYVDNSHLQNPIVDATGVATVNLDEQDRPAEAFDQVIYTEKDYDVGASLTYTFLRWYTLTGGYRYVIHDSDQYEYDVDSYDEHRFYVGIAVDKEVFRW